MKKRILAVLLLAVFALTMAGCGAKKSGEEISITVTVVHGDKSEKQFDLTTTCTNLGDALVEGKVASGRTSSFGLFVTSADGETIDEKKEEWWRITKDGEDLATGVSQTEIADGDEFVMTKNVGYAGM